MGNEVREERKKGRRKRKRGGRKVKERSRRKRTPKQAKMGGGGGGGKWIERRGTIVNSNQEVEMINGKGRKMIRNESKE